MSCKRDDIVNAARNLIAEFGFHGASVAQIADRAGVGAGTIYLYFKSKDILINELYRDIEKKISAFILEDYPATRPIRERFIHLGTRLLTYFIAILSISALWSNSTTLRTERPFAGTGSWTSRAWASTPYITNCSNKGSASRS